MNYMSENQSDSLGSLGLNEELKEIFFLLLKKSPLTLGELSFLTKKSETSIKSSLKELIKSGFVREIDDIIPLYIALYPTLLLKTNLETLLNQLNEFESNFNEKNNTELNGLLKNISTFKTDFQANLTEIINNYETNHLASVQQLENQSQGIIKNSVQAQTDVLKEISNDFSEQRASATSSLNNFSEATQNFVLQFNEKFDGLIEELESLTGLNKKQLRKSVAETIKSLDEGAKLLGKNVNDQLKEFEGKLIDSINSSISATVDLSNGFKNQLTEDYSTWRAENTEYVNKLESQNEDVITDVISSNMEITASNNLKMIEKLSSSLDHFTNVITEISNKSVQISEERSSSFLKEIESKTTKFSDFFRGLKVDLDSNLVSYNTSIEEYKKTLNIEMKTFISNSFQQFEENFKILSQILTEFINNARTSFDKEFNQIIGDNSDILDKIVDILTTLKDNYENELGDLQNNIEGLGNNFKDLSVAIKRRFDKFSSEASSHIHSMGSKIIDELLHIQGSNIELIEGQKSLKQNFASVINSFTEKNNEVISSSQTAFSNLSQNIFNQKTKQLEDIEKEIKEYTSFINERHSILDNQLKAKNDEFITEFKTALSKIREDTQVIIQTEQIDYLKNLTEINSNSDVLLLQQKDLMVDALDGIANSLSKNIQEAIDTITQTFTKIKTSMVNEINQQKNTFTQTFTDINTNVNEISNNYISNYKSVLESSINSLKNIEVTYWSKFEDTFSKNKEKVLEIYKTNSENLQNRTNSVLKMLSSFLDEVVASVSNLNSEISTSLGTLSSDLTNKFNEVQETTNSHFQVFEDLSATLDQISQKSKLEIENELLDIENDLQGVTDKNFESYSQLMNSSTGQFKKTIENLSGVGSEKITQFEKEIQESIQSIKVENEENHETYLQELSTISKESIEDLNIRNSKQLSLIKESKLQLEENSQILTENLMNQIIEKQSTFQNQIITQFNSIEEIIPVRLKEYMDDFKNSVKELFESLNQVIFKEINENIASSGAFFKSTSSENQKTFQQSLTQLKTKFLEQIAVIKDEFQETSKLRLEEIEMQINKELESFSSKLVKKENDDVKRLRELIQSISSVGIFNELVNDNLINNIDPLKNNFENSLNNFQSEFEKLFQNSGISELTEVQKKTMDEFGNLLINVYNTSIGKLNSIQKSFTEQTNQFQENIKTFVEKTIETTKTGEISLLSSTQSKILAITDSQNELLSSSISKMISSFQTSTKELNSLVAEYNQFFNTIHSVITQSDKDTDTLYKNRIITVPDDVEKYLSELISKTNKRIDLILPKPEIFDLKPLINLHTRVMIKIVINLDTKVTKNEKRKTWVSELYKKKANVQLYDSNTISNLIICIRDNKEVLIVSEKKGSELASGFIIENNLFADYFSKSIVNNIISIAKPITRENSN